MSQVSGGPTIVRGTNDKPVASAQLAKYFEQAEYLDGQLFVGYPIIGAADGRNSIDALYVSPTRGLVVFDLVEGADASGFELRLDDAANKLASRLLQYRDLVHRRQLLNNIEAITYAPGLPTGEDWPDVEGYLIANDETLAEALDLVEWPAASQVVHERTLSALQNISTLRRSRGTRTTEKPDSRGARLKALEESVSTLDSIQGKAVIETVDGVQRIRGLAGSGKTIVLALKAAYLHSQHPDWRIAVTFNTRSLKPQFTRLITQFHIESTQEEPNWNNLRILQGWGAPGGGSREGIYHEFCNMNEVQYRDFGDASAFFGRENAFAGVCAEALQVTPSPNEYYDAILADEAQDFPPEFLRLCYSIIKNPKRLVYAYDELQNLSSAGLPSATEIFGVDASGQPVVSLEARNYDYGAQRDLILEMCYRNSRPILASAHSLGFGIYRRPPAPNRPGLVQMFDQPELWHDIGYHLKAGELEGGQNVVLERTPDTSPLFLERHSDPDDLIQFYAFESQQDQALWVANEIKKNLTEDELRPDDIVVINPNPLSTRKNVAPLRKALVDQGIMSHIAGVDTGADVFFRMDSPSITFSGIHRVKGNEAGMVYVIDADECYNSSASLARRRNMLFTAITRSKAWVRVLGVGANMRRLNEEFNAVKASDFELRFTYPTETELAFLQVVHRDMTKEQAEAVSAAKRSAGGLLADLEAGRLRREDLDDELVQRLAQILSQNEE